jgi:DNA (cytosine-5)-methyltransferase 1
MPEVEWVWCSEIDPFCCSLIAHRAPDVPNLGDVTAEDFIERACSYGELDLLVGGSPCQAFSVAGLRRSLGDERGNLTLRFVEIVHAIEPRIVIWENVPGVLSTGDNAFGCFLAGLVGAGCAIECERWTSAGVVAGPLGAAAWRVLDAQYFGLAQRRARVFLVFCPRASGVDPAEILFEFESLRRDSPPSREAGEGTTGTLSARTQGGGGLGTDFDLAGGVVAMSLNAKGGSGRMDAESETFIFGLTGHGEYTDSHAQLRAQGGDCGGGSEFLIAHSLRADGFDASEDGTGRGTRTPIVVHPLTAISGGPVSEDGTGRGVPVISDGSVGVRRLTPRECERLMGFPDDYTLIPYRGKPAADGARYKALGNSMAVPVLRWIYERIKRVD